MHIPISTSALAIRTISALITRAALGTWFDLVMSGFSNG